MKYIQGLTLTELLITLAIVSITGVIALPQLDTTTASADAAATGIYRALQHARGEAKKESNRYRICGSNDGIHCSREWQQQLVLFADSNSNQMLDEGELLQLYPLKAEQLIVQTRLGFGKTSFQFTELGHVDLTGSFLICKPEQKQPLRKVTWNRIGRPYLLKDAAAVAAHSTLQCS